MVDSVAGGGGGGGGLVGDGDGNMVVWLVKVVGDSDGSGGFEVVLRRW